MAVNVPPGTSKRGFETDGNLSSTDGLISGGQSQTSILNTSMPTNFSFASTQSQSTGYANTSIGEAPTALDSSVNFNVGPSTSSSVISGHISKTEISAFDGKNCSLTAGYYGNKYRGNRIWNELNKISTSSCQDTDEGRLAGQKLIQIIRQRNQNSVADFLISPVPIQFCQADMNLRRRICENPIVAVTSEDQHQHEAHLTPTIFNEICSLADSLYISEEDALSLYHFCSTQSDLRSRIRDAGVTTFDPCGSYLNTSNRQADDRSIVFTGQLYYFYERSLNLNTTLMLLQYRQKSTQVGESTDILLQGGLITNLVQLVREYTTLIDQMSQKLQQNNVGAGISSSITVDKVLKNDSQANSLQMHLEFCIQQRQIAAECIFFSAYEVQFRVNEIVTILDVIRDLSNGISLSSVGLPELNPHTDVPDPYENDGTTQKSVISSISSSTWHQQKKIKENSEWQRQLVESVFKMGYPALLRSISTLIAASMVALDTKNVLIDRDTHEPNIFGKGNAIFSPETLDTVALTQIDNRLNKDAAKNWKRPDVLGLLMVAYSMLLRTSPSTISSPRTGGSSSRDGFDIRKSWRDCMKFPAENKSFTFARLSVIPALRKLSIPSGFSCRLYCDVSNFLHTVIAEFTSYYLDELSISGECPPSRAQWEEGAEDTLRIQRLHEEQQRKFHGQFLPTSNYIESSAVPTNIDVSKRPDCIDDIVAFATAICSTHSDYSRRFWSEEVQGESGDGDNRILTPSRFLVDLQARQTNDHSLRPCFLTFLASLATAKNMEYSLNGAAVVHEMLSRNNSAILDGCTHSWSTLLETLRHYVRELNPNFCVPGFDESQTRVTSGSSTAYYYLGKNNVETSETDRITNPTIKPKELGVENTEILLSHLSIMANVALHHPPTRRCILGIILPVRSQDQREIIGQHGALNILFTLSIMPLDPIVRGAVFRTLANLLSLDGLKNDEEMEDARKAAHQGWQLLDACQIVPLRMLEQFSSVRKDFDLYSGLAFPSSSLALVADKVGKSWISSDIRYSIIYEMEHVESSIGLYPSTEGFLHLLKSLFTAGGSPSVSSDQIHYGSTPYMEYIINLILPRALGCFMKLPHLPFRSQNDANRLISLGFETIQCVLSRYCLSVGLLNGKVEIEHIPQQLHEAARSAAYIELSHPGLTNVVVSHPLENDVLSFRKDFNVLLRNDETMRNSLAATIYERQNVVSKSLSTLPKYKSPGFTILSDILSQTGGQLFTIIVQTIQQNRTRSSEVEADRLALTYGLYGATIPTLFSAMEGVGQRYSSKSYRSMTRPLISGMSYPIFSDDCQWDIRAVQGALRLLCSALAREDKWNECIKAAPNQLSVMPCLTFEKKSVPACVDVQSTKISKMLLSVDSETDVLSAIVEYVQLGNSSELLESDTAIAATAFLFYVDKSLRSHQLIDLIYQHKSHATQIAETIGKSIIYCGENGLNVSNVGFLKLILDYTLKILRPSGLSKQSLVHVMLGLPDPQNTEEQTEISSVNYVNCFDGILVLLGNHNLFESTEFVTLASSCYEVIYNLVRLKDDNKHMIVVHYALKRLRKDDFWRTHVMKMNLIVSRCTGTINVDIWHSVAWLVKAVSCELAIQRLDFVPHNMSVPQQSHFIALKYVLFSKGGFIEMVLRTMPIKKHQVDGKGFVPSEEQLRYSKYELTGAPEVVRGYKLINGERMAKLLDLEDSSIESDRILSWANQWNTYTMEDCASAHVSSAIFDLIGSATDSRNPCSIQNIAEHTTDYRILIEILNCICVQSDGALDAALFSTSTLNLALASMMAVRMSPLMKDDRYDNDIDALTSCLLLARVITLSGSSGVGSLNTNDRTCSFACSLIAVLKDLPDKEALWEHCNVFFDASCVLAQIAGHIPLVGLSKAPSKTTVIARATLSSILEIFGNITVGKGSQFCRSVMIQSYTSGSSVLEDILSAVSVLDADVSNLLSTIAMTTSGTELLLESGIIHSLDKAGSNFLREESKFIAVQSDIALYNRADIVTPDFLLGHITLLNAMMASDSRAEIRNDIFSKSLPILKHYQNVLDTILRNFPLDWDVFYATIKYLCQSKLLSLSDATKSQSIATNSDSHTHILQFQAQIAMLTMDIAEHPLPTEFLPEIPSRLKRSSRVDPTHISPGKSWWDFVDVETTHSANGSSNAFIMSSDICSIACEGIDLMCTSLMIVRGNFVDCLSACRALCSCVSALRVVDSLISKSTQFLQRNELKAFHILLPKLADSVIYFLTIIADSVQEMKGLASSRERNTLFNDATFTLDHTAVEAMGLYTTNLQSLHDDKMRLIVEFGLQVRKDLSSI